MATENKLALLNHGAAHLDVGERYVEIGAWFAASIIGAALGNRERRFITIDDFSEWGGRAAACRWNLAATDTRNVTLIEGDAFAVLDAATDLHPVGVFFYDGDHSYDSQIRAFTAIERHLADEALVIVDDIGFPDVAAANRYVAEHRPEFELVFRVDSPSNMEPRWWNGIEVYKYRRGIR